MATSPNKRYDRVRPECATGQLCNPHLPHSLPRTPQCHHFEDAYFLRVSFSPLPEETRPPNGLPGADGDVGDLEEVVVTGGGGVSSVNLTMDLPPLVESDKEAHPQLSSTSL